MKSCFPDFSTFMDTPRIYADSHSADTKGRLRLNCVGTVQDLSRQHVILEEGLDLILYSEDLEVDGRVQFSTDENIWVAVIDWNTIREVELEADRSNALPRSA